MVVEVVVVVGEEGGASRGRAAGARCHVMPGAESQIVKLRRGPRRSEQIVVEGVGWLLAPKHVLCRRAAYQPFTMRPQAKLDGGCQGSGTLPRYGFHATPPPLPYRAGQPPTRHELTSFMGGGTRGSGTTWERPPVASQWEETYVSGSTACKT